MPFNISIKFNKDKYFNMSVIGYLQNRLLIKLSYLLFSYVNVVNLDLKILVNRYKKCFLNF